MWSDRSGRYSSHKVGCPYLRGGECPAPPGLIGCSDDVLREAEDMSRNLLQYLITDEDIAVAVLFIEALHVGLMRDTSSPERVVFR